MKVRTKTIVIRPFRLLKQQLSFLVLFGLFCFMPERFLAAALLFIFLVVFLMIVNKTSPTSKAEVSFSNFSGKFAEPKKCEKELVSSSLSTENVPENRSVLRLVEKKPAFGMHFSAARLRSRNEMNDELLEARIRSLFEDIRDASNLRYQKGLSEIQHLLELRQKSLKGLTPTN